MVLLAYFCSLQKWQVSFDQHSLDSLVEAKPEWETPRKQWSSLCDFGWDKFDDATKLKKRAIELNNGRAAQMGILGLMVHEKLGNVDQLLPPHF